MESGAAAKNAVEMARRLVEARPTARYELDWKTPFELLVATILAGGSKDSSVNAVTPALFARWPDAKAWVSADLAAVEEILRPLGLAKQKAERLAAVCAELVSRFGGGVPGSMDDMLTLPGVQRKTANVVLTNALGIASGVVVDVHVTRVAQRMGLSRSKDPDKIEMDLMKLLPTASWIHFGAATIQHGRYVCTANGPRCTECPLLDLCERNGVAGEVATPSAAPQPAPAVSSTNAWPEAFQVPEAILSKSKVAPMIASVGMNASKLPADWEAVLGDDLERVDLGALMKRVAEEREKANVYPPPDEVFSAFHHTPFEKTRVLLLGQDPYHGAGQAHGLAFSVKPGVKPPPSLVNMYKELSADLGCTIPATGCLIPWAEQGVLLLNTVLTVREGEPNSHQALGWKALTDAVISAVSAKAEHVVVVLWGNHARKKASLVADRHTIVEGAHPSPLSAKLWFGSRPFSKINAALKSHGQSEIDWQIQD